MAKIKLTKTELKTQQDALKQYRRYLPTLQIKKQQLQQEIRLSRERLEENLREREKLVENLSGWIALFGDEAMLQTLRDGIRLERIRRGRMNIAGIMVPTFEGADFRMPELDPALTPWYADDAAEALKQAVALRAAGRIIMEQEKMLSDELRSTSQKVNLFEKVKIPECRENIRQIRIYITDQETAAVARSKIAKKKTVEAAS
ncbi:MAG: V-type ATP synthase subunit D [Lentisphaeria bacterium]|nr:V-type ATP synthase subunit D [Lentisphaeria bacterium]MBQ7394480.1 V-type ATP synthase subunit D [Lentisphaeria bacterium]